MASVTGLVSLSSRLSLSHSRYSLVARMSATYSVLAAGQTKYTCRVSTAAWIQLGTIDELIELEWSMAWQLWLGKEHGIDGWR